MKKISKYIKNNIKFLIFLFIFIITHGIIRENLQAGSNERLISNIILWGCVLLYAIVEAVKKVKSLKDEK